MKRSKNGCRAYNITNRIKQMEWSILFFLKTNLFKKWEEYNTRTSQVVTHPSTTLAQARLTSEFWWDPVH